MKKTLQFVESLFTFIRIVKNSISNQDENSKAFSSLNINSFVQKYEYNKYNKNKITHNTKKYLYHHFL